MAFLNETDMKALLESDKAPALAEGRETAIMKQLLENQAKYMVEDATSLSGDVATFSKILVPAVRRVFSGLFAKELVSVQPMSGPTGYVYAQRFFYKGSKTTPVSTTMKVITFHESVAGGGAAIAVGNTVTGPTGSATVKYVEMDSTKNDAGLSVGRAIIDVSVAFTAGEEFDVGGTYTDGGDNEWVVDGVYSSEMAYKQILKNYSGTYSTADGEVLGDDMNQVGFRIDKATVTAKTRKLKSEYTVELIQDLMSQHGKNAETELLDLLQYEIQADIDREILDNVRGSAKLLPDLAVNSISGRWEVEKFAGVYTKILKMCEDIAIDTKRGAGNVVVASPNVIVALSLTNKIKFSSIDLDTTLSTGLGVNVAFVGTLDNGAKVYRDTFATEDSVLVAYKGNTAADAGSFFSPYTPLMVQKATNASTLQPVIGVMSRYGITSNPLVDDNTANPYFRLCYVDFSSTTLA